MVKAVAFFKRRPGMALDAFQTYWLTRHPDVVSRLPGLRRYVQSHTRPATYRDGEPLYDGIAELWFDDSGAMRAHRDTAEMAAVQADEAQFIDRSTMGLIITGRARGQGRTRRGGRRQDRRVRSPEARHDRRSVPASLARSARPA